MGDMALLSLGTGLLIRGLGMLPYPPGDPVTITLVRYFRNFRGSSNTREILATSDLRSNRFDS